MSYLIFYRYYALLNWYKLAKSDIPIDVPLIKSEEFINKFTDIFNKNINKLIKLHKPNDSITNTDKFRVIFAQDCSRCDIWRIKHYPKYKQNRDYTNFIGKSIFPIAIEIINKLCKENNEYSLIKCENCEGDDIVAVVSKYFKDEEQIIYTSDHDYLQLIRPNISIFDLKGKNIGEKSIGDAEKDLILKILIGDKSDNIQSVKYRLGIKTALKIINNKDKLNKLLNDEDIKKKYELNKLLIDFNMIPNELIIKIKELIISLKI